MKHLHLARAAFVLVSSLALTRLVGALPAGQESLPELPRAEAGTLSPSAILPIAQVQAGMEGAVWTVFKGTEPEPFSVKVTGVLQNALGPGKSLIVCELTDPRVQSMGATAGMSGSPLYIGGKLVGALSYQIQRFETVRYAGFTPAADLREVGGMAGLSTHGMKSSMAGQRAQADSELRPVAMPLVLSGVSPELVRLLSPEFERLGLQLGALSGSQSAGSGAAAGAGMLKPGSPVAVALATGDISLAGTGTVSMVEGDRITAFGHPMLNLGEVDIPLCSAEILTILPSTLNSFKLANVGNPIGTLRQDRLSAVSGFLGETPPMIEVEVEVKGLPAGPKRIRYQVVRHEQLSPMLTAIGVLQAVSGSNGFGTSQGFSVREEVEYPGQALYVNESLQAGPLALMASLREFLGELSLQLYNPYEKVFPKRIHISVEALAENPQVVIESLRVPGVAPRPGESLQVLVGWRDHQGASHRETLSIPVPGHWAGRSLDLVLASGRMLDKMSGRAASLSASKYRSFGALLDAMRDGRRPDGLYLAVLEKGMRFSDQALQTAELPGSLERVALKADETRFQRGDAAVVLHEQHLLPGRLGQAALHRPFNVSE